MVSRDFLFFRRKNVAFSFRTQKNLFNGSEKVVQNNDLAAEPGGHNSGFIDKIRQIGAGKSRSSFGDSAKIDAFLQRLVRRVNLQNLLAVVNVRLVKHDAPVKTSGPEKRRIQNIGAVGCRHDDKLLVGFKAVHLHQNLVEGLFALVVAATHPGAAVAADGVNLVNKDD